MNMECTMKSLLLGVAALLGVAFSTTAEAKHNKKDTVIVVDPSHKMNKKGHPHKDASQMKQAMKDGRLTQAEANKLRAEKHKIQQMKKAAAADGVITPLEAKKISKAKKRFHHHKEQALTNGNVR
jgi:hypothetical protein